MKYLSDLIFNELEKKFLNQESFAAFDITKAVRENSKGQNIWDLDDLNIPHDRVRDFVHRFMGLYVGYSSYSNGQYIVYTPTSKNQPEEKQVEPKQVEPKQVETGPGPVSGKDFLDELMKLIANGKWSFVPKFKSVINSDKVEQEIESVVDILKRSGIL